MDYKKAYVQAASVCVILAVLTVGINMFCLFLRTDENHNWMLAINLLTDWLCGVFLVYFLSCYVMPKKALYRLSCKRRENLRGAIAAVEEQPVCYEKLPCVAVRIGDRKLFAPEGLPLPQVGEEATFFVAGNVILEVCR